MAALHSALPDIIYYTACGFLALVVLSVLRAMEASNAPWSQMFKNRPGAERSLQRGAFFGGNFLLVIIFLSQVLEFDPEKVAEWGASMQSLFSENGATSMVGGSLSALYLWGKISGKSD